MWSVYVTYALGGNARRGYLIEVEADDREDAILAAGMRIEPDAQQPTVLAVRYQS